MLEIVNAPAKSIGGVAAALIVGRRAEIQHSRISVFVAASVERSSLKRRGLRNILYGRKHELWYDNEISGSARNAQPNTASLAAR